jgi:apolipoprotein N-acyltransferase
MLRAYTFFRFPWCLLGYSQHEHPVVIQIASLTAVYGVSFLVVLCSAALAYQAFETRTTRRRATSAACLALIAAILIWGTSRVAHPPASRGSVRVGLVQASILQDEKWDPDQAAGHLESHVRLTRLAAASGARIVIWPESSVPYLVDYQPAIAQQLADLARERGISLMVGTDDLEAN